MSVTVTQVLDWYKLQVDAEEDEDGEEEYKFQFYAHCDDTQPGATITLPARIFPDVTSAQNLGVLQVPSMLSRDVKKYMECMVCHISSSPTAYNVYIYYNDCFPSGVQRKLV